jgi:hypothetical protein
LFKGAFALAARFAFAAETSLERSVALQNVQGQTAKNGTNFRPVSLADAAGVLPKSNVQDMLLRVLRAPVCAKSFARARTLQGKLLMKYSCDSWTTPSISCPAPTPKLLFGES